MNSQLRGDLKLKFGTSVMKKLYQIPIMTITVLLCFTPYSICHITVADDGWHFEQEDSPYSGAYNFVPFGTNYWDPDTFVWVGIYDPFPDYSGGLNSCGGNYNGSLQMYDWITVGKLTENDDILIYSFSKIIWQF